MGKKIILNTQCRRCLGPLTHVDRAVKNKLTGEETIVKKLLHKDLCKACLTKDEKKKNKIKRNQKKLGIKLVRKSHKPKWKSKPEPLGSNNPLPVIYAKKNKAGDILIKFSPKERWTKISKQRYYSLAKLNSFLWNPEEKKVSLIIT